MDLKSRISTPLEAGPSILDAHRLPTFLMPALEYTSQRLADRGLHVTLVVARRDYQLPDAVEKLDQAASAALPSNILPTPPCSPNSPHTLRYTPSFTSIRSLVRSGSQHSTRSKASSLSSRPSIASLFDGGITSSRLPWSHAPAHASCTPKTPQTPKTPATPRSFLTATSPTTYSPAGGPAVPQGALRLIYTTPLAPRAHKLVTSTLARAARKYNLSTPLTAHEASAYNLPRVVLHGSILQNEVLHSSDGLTLLSLDHLYTFKAALGHLAAGRSEPDSHFRLEDAVDELRRYVLSVAGGRRRLLKSVLVTAYDWLGPVCDAALGEVTTMYARAYGSASETGVEDDLVREGSEVVGESPAADAASREVTPVPSSSPRSAAGASMHAADGVASDSPAASPDVQIKETIPDEPRKVDTPHQEAKLVTVDATLKPVAPIAKRNPAQQKTTTEKPPPDLQKALPKLPTSASASPPPIITPSPRVTPRASLPSLKLQTTFAAPPTRSPRRLAPLATETRDIMIEITVPEADEAPVSAQTEFEDGSATARSPAGSMWLGIDEILGGGGGVADASSCRVGLNRVSRRLSSSWLELQTPVAERMGPTTPNGYDDISPITRGEWGFLMVSDQFKAKTAAVSCV